MDLFYTRLGRVAFLGWLLVGHVNASAQSDVMDRTEVGDRLVAEYFRQETVALSQDVVAPGMTLPELKRQQRLDRQRLAEMLGLDPMPDRTPLSSVIVETQTRDGFRVERLHFQPSPGLYVAANFYLPPRVDQPLPTILYLCGHANTAQDGVRPGNKAAYHHHGVWFAKNGYACLIVDTIQWGELAGEHHGTYRLGRWWWNNRGFTPAGVEAWTGIRAVDYLESREEVDADRIGITGRSGGGAYSWWVAALDQRVAVAVPVAGITTLQNHVVDGCVEGHCDCMYMINTYRWDYGRVAALVAPRPLLISNSDKDRIFPLDGVVEVHRQVRDVYELHGKSDHLGLQITEGPHKDTQELRVHAFRWFNRFLKNDDSLIRFPAEKSIELNELAVFDRLPDYERVTTADDWFVPKIETPASNWEALLRQKSFGGWPSEEDTASLNPQRIATAAKDGVRCDVIEFDSQPPYQLSLFVVRDDSALPQTSDVVMEILRQQDWDQVAGGIAAIVPDALPGTAASAESFAFVSDRLKRKPNRTLVWFAPRGVGPTQWSRDTKKQRHIRRRFALLGQTVDGMRIWDVRRAIAAARTMPTTSVPKTADWSLSLRGTGDAAEWALFASLFGVPVGEFQLSGLPVNDRDGITLLSLDRVVDRDRVLKRVMTQSKVTFLD